MKYILSILIFLQFNNASYAQTSITIYKDDRALIKQKILWELEQESNVISWDSLPSGLIDGSTFLNLKNARILTQRLNNNTFRFRENLKNKIGENIEIKLVNEREISGVLVEFDNSIFQSLEDTLGQFFLELFDPNQDFDHKNIDDQCRFCD